MTARIRPAARFPIVAAALFLIGVAVNARLLARSLHPSPNADALWNPSTIDASLAHIAAQLPPNCTVAWSPAPSAPRPHDAEPLYLLQYTLAPRIVTAAVDADWRLTESPDQQLTLEPRPAK